MTPKLGETEKKVIVAAISQFRVIEDQVERAVAANNYESLDEARLNRIVSKQMESQLDHVRNLMRQSEGYGRWVDTEKVCRSRLNS